jgi:O-antigen/teichoic acid export membrane protein
LRFSAAQTIEQVLPEALSRRAQPLAGLVDRLVSGTDEASAAQRTTLVAFSIRVASAAIAFLSQVALARLMGAFEYGVFVLVWVSMIIIGNLSCFGFHTAIVRFLPQYRERGDLDRVRGLLLAGRIFVLATSTAMTALAMAAAQFGSSWFQSYYVVPFMIGALALPMIALGDTLTGTARANGWSIRSLGPTYILRPLLILAFLVGAWALNYPVNGVTALVCAVLATYLTTLGQLIVVTVSLDRHFPPGPHRTELPLWVSVSLPIFLVEGFFFLLVNADVLMVGALMRPDDTAVYFATVKTLALVHFVYFAVKAGVAHRFAARIDDTDKSALHDLARRSVNWTFWPSLAMAGMILLAGPLLLSMFGADFGRGYPLLFILAAGVVLRAAIGPAESLLTMSGNQNVCAALFGGVLAINVALNALMIPVYGLYGAALATLIATIVETFALYQLVWSRIGVRMFVFMPARKTDR